MPQSLGDFAVSDERERERENLRATGGGVSVCSIFFVTIMFVFQNNTKPF